MELRIARRFRIGPKIGSGSFGEIYRGTNVLTGEEVAIKLEPVQSKHPQLIYESKLYRVLKGGSKHDVFHFINCVLFNTVVGIPDLKWFGPQDDFNVMVIDLLGQSLEDLFNYCGRLFSLKTVLMIAEQLITRVEFIHSRGYMHRDIKPDNFLIGRKQNRVGL